jgi:hypothetical protein
MLPTHENLVAEYEARVRSDNERAALRARFEALAFDDLEEEVLVLRTILEVSEQVLTERLHVLSRLRRMSVGELERYVLQRRPDWKSAKRLLDEARSLGADLGQMPNGPPAPENVVPHDPEGTAGDYWRYKSG